MIAFYEKEDEMGTDSADHHGGVGFVVFAFRG